MNTRSRIGTGMDDERTISSESKQQLFRADRPAISVVIPTWNRASELPRSLASVLNQDSRSFEVIVVDDGSTDATHEVLRSIHDVRVRIVCSRNSGASVARNRGVDEARGESITFLDSDDEALPSWLSCFERLLSDPGVGLAFCGAEDVVENKVVVRRPARMDAAFENIVGLFLPGTYAVRRGVFEAVGGFSPSMRYGEHHEMGLRMVPYCQQQGWRMASIPTPLVRRHRPDNAKERLKTYRKARYESNLQLIEWHAEKIGRNPARLANHLTNAGVSAIGLGNISEGRRLLFRAILAHPSAMRSYARLLAAFVPAIARRLW